MAFNFNNQTWSLDGDHQLGSNLKLLNPKLSVEHVVVKDGSVFVRFNATENGGTYVHAFTMQVDEPTTADINKLIESVMKDTFNV